MASNLGAVADFMAITGMSDEGQAVAFLDAHQWNLQRAVQSHMESSAQSIAGVHRIGGGSDTRRAHSAGSADGGGGAASSSRRHRRRRRKRHLEEAPSAASAPASASASTSSSPLGDG